MHVRRIPYAWLIAGAALALGAAGVSALPARGAPAGLSAPGAAAVEEAIARDGSARVIVSLREPSSSRRMPLDRGALARDVADVRERVIASVPATVVRRFAVMPGFVATVGTPGLAGLLHHPDVVAVTLDGQGSGATDDSLPMIGGTAVQALGYSGAGMTAAVIDSGIDTNHPDLEADVIAQECFLLEGSCPGGGTRKSGVGSAEDNNGHGTNVSGIITSAGGVAPIGVAPDTGILAYKVLNAANTGYLSDWAAALDHVLANHPEVDVVNMSLGSNLLFAGTCDAHIPAFTSTVASLRNAGVLIAASAGNNVMKESMAWPACVDGVVAVGAVFDEDFASSSGYACTNTPAPRDEVTCWSNSSVALDLLAPGALITSTGIGGGTSTYRGTSQAAPHVAAVIALLKQADPSLTAAEIEARLESTGVLRTDAANGRVTPRLDALAAIRDSVPDIDSDADGCKDLVEVGADPVAGGDRDPFEVYDFYDVTDDAAIDLADTLYILLHFGHAPDGDAEDPFLDRYAPDPGRPYRTAHAGGVDAGIDLADALLNLGSFGHACLPEASTADASSP